ncbi:MAG TPA: hypothetical protein VKA70_18730 [Blastocatellia bacterium]|nr:hypothetical protein [Blastocatellia bacterium]
MIKVVTISLVLLTFAACAGDTAEQATVEREPVPSFRVESEQPDLASRAITVNIRFQGPVTESQAMSAAEFVIADRKERFDTITVESFLPGANSTASPFVSSKFKNGATTHVYGQGSRDVRIPTH